MTEQTQPAPLPQPIDRPAQIRTLATVSKVMIATSAAFFQMGYIGGRNGLILMGLGVACFIPAWVASSFEGNLLRSMTVGLGKPVGSFTTTLLPLICAFGAGYLAGETAYAMKVSPTAGLPIGFVYAGTVGLVGFLQTRKLFKQVDAADRQLKLKEAQAGPPKGIAA